MALRAGQPGSVLCGFRTYALIEREVRAVPREPLTVKGSSRPFEAWEILEPSSSEPTVPANVLTGAGRLPRVTATGVRVEGDGCRIAS